MVTPYYETFERRKGGIRWRKMWIHSHGHKAPRGIAGRFVENMRKQNPGFDYKMVRLPSHKPPISKRFGKKLYRRSMTTNHKITAYKEAKRWRKKGYFARVHIANYYEGKTNLKYHVYFVPPGGFGSKQHKELRKKL